MIRFKNCRNKYCKMKTIFKKIRRLYNNLRKNYRKCKNLIPNY